MDQTKLSSVRSIHERLAQLKTARDSLKSEGTDYSGLDLEIECLKTRLEQLMNSELSAQSFFNLKDQLELKKQLQSLASYTDPSGKEFYLLDRATHAKLMKMWDEL